MFKLQRQAPEATWITLENGVELSIRPYNSAEWFGLRASHTDKPDNERYAYFLAELVARCGQDWRGVFDEAGDPMPFEPEFARMLILNHPAQAVAFSFAYQKIIDSWEQEKKISANGHAGTTDEAPLTAKHATSSGSRARRGRPAKMASSALT